MDCIEMAKDYIKVLEKLKKHLEENGVFIQEYYKKDSNNKKIKTATVLISPQEQFWTTLREKYSDEWMEMFNEYMRISGIGVETLMNEEAEYDPITANTNFCPFDGINMKRLKSCLYHSKKLKKERMISWALTTVVGAIVGEIIVKNFVRLLTMFS